MNWISKLAIVIVFGAVVSTDALGKAWKGIVPLRSTRADVERMLGTPSQNLEVSSFYSMAEESVVIAYQVGACQESPGMFGIGWNVPKDTVIAIGVIPKRAIRRDEITREGSFKTEPTDGGFVYYVNKVDGLTIETFKDKVTLVHYEPEASQETLRCPRVQKCCIHFFPRFDEYEKLSWADEKARLDNYVIHMRNDNLRGVLIVYGKNPAARRKLLQRAERARNYLSNVRGLEAQRLLMVDGGYKDRAVTELNFHSIAGAMNRVYLFPQKDPVPATRKKLLRVRS